MATAPIESLKLVRFWNQGTDEPDGLFDDWDDAEDLIQAVIESDPRFGSIIDPRDVKRIAYSSELAAIKRFSEWYKSDPEFREHVADNPQEAVEKYGIGITAEEVACLWDARQAEKLDRDTEWTPPLAILRHKLFMKEKLLHRGRLRTEGCAPQDSRHRAWRHRQIRRGLAELGTALYQGIVHAPFAIELSEGCSVGCWFCGVSAEKKKSDFLYTDDNAALWKEVLGVLSRKMGPAASTGFCYWATDPLDNPDYEKFCLDFSRICGVFPQTTTAQAHKHIERTKKLLALSNEHGCTINRFSVLTLKAFKKIMEAFTAEEMLHCEIVPQNFETEHFQSSAGRARNSRGMLKKKERLHVPKEAEMPPGTIACISGFLINMVTRTIRLITPCAASEAWPDGYWILDEAVFETALDFEYQIERMTAEHMRQSLRSTDLIKLHPAVKLDRNQDTLLIKGSDTMIQLPNSVHLEEFLRSGSSQAGEIAVRIEDQGGIPAYQTMALLNTFFEHGILDEAPARSSVAK